MNFSGLGERQLHDVWDAVSGMARPWKEVAIISATTSNESAEQCGRLSIGERDRRILMLHAHTFGGRFDCETRCPACHSRMAFSFSTSDLGLQPREVDADSLMLTEGRIVVRFRLPNSADVAACLTATDPAVQLFVKCVRVMSSPAHRRGQLGARELPMSLRYSVIERMAALDPNADLMFEMGCPECHQDTKVMFDPVAALLQQSGRKATPQEWRSGPGSSLPEFLDRLIARHTHEAVVHALAP